MFKALFDRLLVILASLYVSRHLEHHCHGEHCHVCHHIHHCLELITVCMEMVVASFEIALCCVFFRLPRIKVLYTSRATLVSQKVLLLN